MEFQLNKQKLKEITFNATPVSGNDFYRVDEAGPAPKPLTPAPKTDGQQPANGYSKNNRHH